MTEFCEICPRKCKVNRENSVGFCKESSEIRVAKIIRHFTWEEPCLSGKQGTLAIFFSGCNLACDYCQNHEISRGGIGKTYSPQEFAKLIEQEQKEHDSIDLITPTHFSSALCEAFKLVRVNIPVIWNTNGYETEENIMKVADFVNIFLTDFKYADNLLAQKFSNCKDYFSVALPATQKMCHLKTDEFDGEQMKQGVIIRHLVLPGFVKNSLAVLDVVKNHFPSRMLSVMSQFTPNGKSSLNRKITAIEYKTVLSHMNKLSLERGYIQDFDSACDSFVPNFI